METGSSCYKVRLEGAGNCQWTVVLCSDGVVAGTSHNQGQYNLWAENVQIGNLILLRNDIRDKVGENKSTFHLYQLTHGEGPNGSLSLVERNAYHFQEWLFLSDGLIKSKSQGGYSLSPHHWGYLAALEQNWMWSEHYRRLFEAATGEKPKDLPGGWAKEFVDMLSRLVAGNQAIQKLGEVKTGLMEMLDSGDLAYLHSIIVEQKKGVMRNTTLHVAVQAMALLTLCCQGLGISLTDAQKSELIHI
jgi:hypothetical protein